MQKKKKKKKEIIFINHLPYQTFVPLYHNSASCPYPLPIKYMTSIYQR